MRLKGQNKLNLAPGHDCSRIDACFIKQSSAGSHLAHIVFSTYLCLFYIFSFNTLTFPFLCEKVSQKKKNEDI